VNDLATINVMGIDSNDNGRVEVTAVVVKPSALFSENITGGTGANQQSNFIIASAAGSNVYEAIGRLSRAITGRVYFGHLDVVIFGKQAAENSLIQTMEYFRRAIDIRPSTKILISQGDAKSLVSTRPHQKVTLGLEIRDLISTNRYTSSGIVQDFSQFGEALYGKWHDTYTGVILDASQSGIDVMSETPGRQQSRSTGRDIPELLSLGGIAVFKEGKLAGFLESSESQGLLWMKGEMQDEIVTLPCGERGEETVSLKIRRSKAQLLPSISSGSPAMTVLMQVEADIGQMTCRDFSYSGKEFDELDKQLKARAIEEAGAVLRRAQKTWQTDIFGFGRAIWRRYPKVWTQLAPHWREGGFADLPVTFEVQANVSRAGMSKALGMAR
jgi:spore germination protein KC